MRHDAADSPLFRCRAAPVLWRHEISRSADFGYSSTSRRGSQSRVPEAQRIPPKHRGATREGVREAALVRVLRRTLIPRRRGPGPTPDMDSLDEDADDDTRAPPAPRPGSSWRRLANAPHKRSGRQGIMHLRASLRQREKRQTLMHAQADLRLMVGLLPVDTKQSERVQRRWHNVVQRESQLKASRSAAIVRIQQQARYRDEMQALCRACCSVVDKRGKHPWTLPGGFEVVSWLRRFVFVTESALCYRRCCSQRRQQLVDVASTRTIMLIDIEQIIGKVKSRIICVRARYRGTEDEDDDIMEGAHGRSVVHEFRFPSVEATKCVRSG